MRWLITFAVLFLLAILPLGGDIRYGEDGLTVFVKAGPLRIQVLPLKKKSNKKKPKKEKKTAEKKKESASNAQKSAAETSSSAPKPVPAKKEKGGSITDFLPLLQLALDFLGDFRRKLRLNCLELKLILAGDDPCDLAVNYGRAWAAIGNLVPMLERAFVIKKRDLEVECDFEASATTVYARLDISITLGRLISLAVVYACRALIELLKLKKKRKGGVS